MKKNKSLLISLIIFVISVILVVSIGTIPLPDYESNRTLYKGWLPSPF